MVSQLRVWRLRRDDVMRRLITQYDLCQSVEAGTHRFFRICGGLSWLQEDQERTIEDLEAYRRHLREAARERRRTIDLRIARVQAMAAP